MPETWGARQSPVSAPGSAASSEMAAGRRRDGVGAGRRGTPPSTAPGAAPGTVPRYVPARHLAPAPSLSPAPSLTDLSRESVLKKMTDDGPHPENLYRSSPDIHLGEIQHKSGPVPML